MTNIVFDTQNLFFRSTFTVGGYGKSNYTFDSQRELDQLMRKVSMDISSIIRTVNPNRIIFTVDSRSWRKDIPIDENEGYKANRKQSEFINWDNIFKTMSEFSDILESNGFIVTKVKNAEADDLMALWRDELLYNKGQHVIIVTGDEDMRQLVAKNVVDGKEIFCTIYNPFTQGKNPTKKLFVPEGFEEWLNDDSDPGDFFNRGIDVDKEDFQRILKEKVKMEQINGNDIALKKVFCGDDGDNVPAIYTWLEKTDKGIDKKVRITESKYQKIKKLVDINEPMDLLNDSKQTVIYNKITEICKHNPPFKIKDRINRQMELVVLMKELFPKQILEDFNSKLEEDYKKPGTRSQAINMSSILEGTRYIDNKDSGSESSIFSQIDRISNKELF